MGFHDKTQHLAAIHKAPEECWENLVKVLSDSPDWSAKSTAEVVQELNEALSLIPDFWREACFPPPLVAASIARRFKTAPAIGRLAAKCSELLEAAEAKDCRGEILDWLKVNAGADSWDLAALQRKLIEIEEFEEPTGEAARKCLTTPRK